MSRLNCTGSTADTRPGSQATKPRVKIETQRKKLMSLWIRRKGPGSDGLLARIERSGIRSSVKRGDRSQRPRPSGRNGILAVSIKEGLGRAGEAVWRPALPGAPRRPRRLDTAAPCTFALSCSSLVSFCGDWSRSAPRGRRPRLQVPRFDKRGYGSWPAEERTTSPSFRRYS